MINKKDFLKKVGKVFAKVTKKLGGGVSGGMNKVFNDKLHSDPKAWLENRISQYRTGYIFFITTFVTITLLTLLCALVIALVPSLVFGLLQPGGAPPEWYRYFPVSVTVVGGFLGSLLGFFAARQRYGSARKNINYIKSELLLLSSNSHEYASSKNPHLLIAQKVAAFTGFGQGELA